MLSLKSYGVQVKISFRKHSIFDGSFDLNCGNSIARFFARVGKYGNFANEKVQHAILVAMKSGSQFVNSVAQVVGVRPPQSMSPLTQRQHAFQAFCIGGWFAPFEAVEPLQNLSDFASVLKYANFRRRHRFRPYNNIAIISICQTCYSRCGTNASCAPANAVFFGFLANSMPVILTPPTISANVG
jgi:hypothetical protein